MRSEIVSIASEISSQKKNVASMFSQLDTKHGEFATKLNNTLKADAKRDTKDAVREMVDSIKAELRKENIDYMKREVETLREGIVAQVREAINNDILRITSEVAREVSNDVTAEVKVFLQGQVASIREQAIQSANAEVHERCKALICTMLKSSLACVEAEPIVQPLAETPVQPPVQPLVRAVEARAVRSRGRKRIIEEEPDEEENGKDSDDELYVISEGFSTEEDVSEDDMSVSSSLTSVLKSGPKKRKLLDSDHLDVELLRVRRQKHKYSINKPFAQLIASLGKEVVTNYFETYIEGKHGGEALGVKQRAVIDRDLLNGHVFMYDVEHIEGKPFHIISINGERYLMGISLIKNMSGGCKSFVGTWRNEKWFDFNTAINDTLDVFIAKSHSAEHPASNISRYYLSARGALKTCLYLCCKSNCMEENVQKIKQYWPLIQSLTSTLRITSESASTV